MALPVVFNTVTVYDDFIDLKGRPLSGTVSFAGHVMRTTVLDGPTIVPVAETATIDPATGRFSIDLPASNDPDITPDDTYTVTQNLAGVEPLLASRTPFDITVDYRLTSVRLRTIAPVGDVVAGAAYLTEIRGNQLYLPLNDSTPAVIRYTNGAYPLRSTVTSSLTRTVIYIGPVAPSGAVASVDVWWSTVAGSGGTTTTSSALYPSMTLYPSLTLYPTSTAAAPGALTPSAALYPTGALFPKAA